ncbi:hypothetical protein N9A94_01720 [Akkermansiaceae bacterium]|nr:hypothetical protein [Akkermansiaceae bacterium]MDB4537427.1 hypothetical protein [Akkermansiaceae bacterium]
MISRILSLIFCGSFLVSCSPDPRWGPPRSGLREPMEWQYKDSAKPTSIAYYEPTSRRPEPPVEFLAYRPESKPTDEIWDKKVRLVNGRAVAPSSAPIAIKRAVEAGNRLQRFPYRMGGGHARLNDTAYDCSGAVSLVLREAGLMNDQMPSRGFLNYGEYGPGEWITVWAKNGHVFMTIGGLRLDTGGNPESHGPRWKSSTRSKAGFVPRHPRGY